ncbi:hypothetical protein Stsp02_19940 [Streptomyces sp. NBRC 14336]|uniref:hypothetical protein n=1 Tax=Streptomyces sp. NBRC 14336 TaxID=3030992 RepID=UPI0024A15E40|nr:hypothetical protein [Streptomyces sp. NBRC 14336]WBO81745.1 hypothetical protein SBE_005622 [Streptomyces sp. SBE_14.2]GLW46332.1 hypothetical protein Stsp02_19940 [Streptomyces sp. NBRC 14336]
MTSPAPRRGGIVFLDPEQGRVLRVVPFQYNPDSITRTLRPRGIGADAGDRLEALRLQGPPRETFRVEAEFDATDQLGTAGGPGPPAESGLFGMLSALETAVSPSVEQLTRQNDLAAKGILEIAPVQGPLPVLVLGPRRVLPVRMLDIDVTEEAYDGELNPIRARVLLTVRILTVDDVGFSHRAGGLHLQYQQGRERFAGLVGYGPGAVGYSEG